MAPSPRLPEPPSPELTPRDTIPAPILSDPSPPAPDGLATVLRPRSEARERRTVAGRFGRPGDALAYFGQAMDVASAEPVVGRAAAGTWWVVADLLLDQARELVELCGGRPLVRSSEQWLVDRGWGDPPQPGQPHAEPVPDPEPVPVMELIRAAGLSRLPASREAELAVLAPAGRVVRLVQRALDLGLTSTIRPVAVEPLFADEAAGGTLVEVRLRVRDRAADPYLPAMLLAALDRDRGLLVCRTDDERLLVQRGRHSALTDRQLAALVAEPVWVLADPPHGCWRLTPLGEPADATTLVRLGDDVSLVPGDPIWPATDDGSPLAPAPLTVVREPTPEAAVDAVLLRDRDLRALPSLLEGHPIAEVAELVTGRERHLLLAPGGILERIPIGEYLYAVGPGPVYLPHGWRTRPRLPATAWRALVDPSTAVALVLTAARSLAFDLSRRRPVWELWAGDLPPLFVELPDGVQSVLVKLDADLQPPVRPPAPPPPPPPSGFRRVMERLARSRPHGRTRSWQEEAAEAERLGDLYRAADLFDRHGQPRRAAHLFERAAREGSIPSSMETR